MKTMTAKYSGTCSRTGKPIRVGDQINIFGRGRAELVLASSPSDYGFAGGDEFEDSDEDEAAGFEPGTLANDRRLARSGLFVIRFASGHVVSNAQRNGVEVYMKTQIRLAVLVVMPARVVCASRINCGSRKKTGWTRNTESCCLRTMRFQKGYENDKILQRTHA